MTDELKGFGEGAYISEFGAAAPKKYAYRVTIDGVNVVNETHKARGYVFCIKRKKLLISTDSRRW